MTDEIQNNTSIESSTVDSDTTPEKPDAVATQTNPSDELAAKMKAMDEQFKKLEQQLENKEKEQKKKEQLEQISIMEQRIQDLTSKLEEQQDMNASTRVDGASTVRPAQNVNDIDLNFKTQSESDWQRNVNKFLKQTYNING